jgi:hypothetical protein
VSFADPRWLILPSGAGVWLPEARPCRCGNTLKLVGYSMAYCQRCIKPDPPQRIFGWIDCEAGTYHEGRPR